GDGRGPDRASRTDRISHARVLHDAPRAGLYPRPAARSDLGWKCLRRGTYDRRAYPQASQSSGGVRIRSVRADRPRLGLSILGSYPVAGPGWVLRRSVEFEDAHAAGDTGMVVRGGSHDRD